MIRRPRISALDYRTCAYVRHERRSDIIAPNTLVTGEAPCYALVFHGHTIAEFFPDGSIRLYSQGYRTVTTKSRLNQFVHGVSVYQKDYTWYVNGDREFHEGIIIAPRADMVSWDHITSGCETHNYGILADYLDDCGYGELAKVLRGES